MCVCVIGMCMCFCVCVCFYLMLLHPALLLRHPGLSVDTSLSPYCLFQSPSYSLSHPMRSWGSNSDML